MSQTTEKVTDEAEENEFDFTIICNETGKEFESMDDFELHRKEQKRKQKIKKARELLSEDYGLDVDKIEELQGKDFKTLVDNSISSVKLATSYENTSPRILVGVILNYMGELPRGQAPRLLPTD